MDLQHIAVKLFAKDNPTLDPGLFIPIFHGWIQRKALDDVLLIDVADYSHVHHGPGVMLICQEGHFALDQAGGEPGLLYANKRLAAGSVPDRLRTAIARALTAAKLLEAEPTLAGKLTFRADRFHIRIDDRICAPNTEAIMDALRDDLQQVVSALCGGATIDLQHAPDPKTGFTVIATAPSSGSLAALLESATDSQPSPG